MQTCKYCNYSELKKIHECSHSGNTLLQGYVMVKKCSRINVNNNDDVMYYKVYE